jgi:hypothetical protein
MPGSPGGRIIRTAGQSESAAGQTTTLTAEAGSFNLAGQTGTFRTTIFAAAGAAGLSGQDAGLLRLVVLNADPAGFAVVGQGAAFRVDLAATASDLALTGVDVLFAAALAGTAADYVLTGQTAALSESVSAPEPEQIMLTADPAGFALTGPAAVFRIELSADFGAFGCVGCAVPQPITADHPFVPRKRLRPWPHAEPPRATRHSPAYVRKLIEQGL